MNSVTEALVERVAVPPSQQLILDVLIARQRHGVSDMTDWEIREVLEQIHSPRRFELGQVANRVSDLVKAQVVKEGEPRLNPRTKKLNRTVYLPEAQARLCA